MLRHDCGCIRNRPLYPHSLLPTLVHSYSSLEGVNENEWVNSHTEWQVQDCHFCIVCLLFNNHLKQASPAVRLKDLYWTICALSEGIGNDFGYSLCLLCFRLLSARCLIGYCLVSRDNLQIKRAFVLSVSPPPHSRISDVIWICKMFTIRHRGASDVLPSRFSHS